MDNAIVGKLFGHFVCLCVYSRAVTRGSIFLSGAGICRKEQKAVQMKRGIFILTESAILVAAAVALSMITLFRMPLGGSVTPFATLPVIVAGLRHGTKWGIATAIVFSFTQLFLGMANVAAVPVKTVWNMALCAALDYILAYTFLGFTGAVARRFRKPALGLSAGIVITGLGRLACSFLSGVIIWGVYAYDGWNVAVYSLAYNAAWCVPDTAITLVVCLLLAQVRPLGLFPSAQGVRS